MIQIPKNLKPENFKVESIETNENYKLINIQKKLKLQYLTVKDIYRFFLIEFEKIFNKKFIETTENKELLTTILYYFIKNDRFFNSPCLIKPECTIPSFDKGLLIMGNTGVGKTSILLALENVFNNYIIYNSTIHFKSISAYQLVNEFEKLNTPEEKEDFFMKHQRGFRYYDDVKSEKDASNFGKVNLIKIILYQRNEKRLRTIITCNYDESFPNNFEKGLDEFGTRYDARIYDRLFSDFNFIEARGKSMRR